MKIKKPVLYPRKNALLTFHTDLGGSRLQRE